MADMINCDSTTSWLLGCHDAPRVATRYGLPQEEERSALQVAQSWLLTDGTTPRLDRALGERRARAAIMILLALPGSTYIYQGDELGLQEVGDLPSEVWRIRWRPARRRTRAATAAGYRCRGRRRGRRTDSARRSGTCRSRIGSAVTR